MKKIEKAEQAVEISAGAVVFFEEDGKREYLLLFRKGHDGFKDYYGFVQGNIEKGEDPKTAVYREAKEETGLDISIIPGFKHEIKYFYKRENTLVKKKVIFFVAKARSKEVKLSEEHDAYFWLELNDAIKRLKFKNQKELIQKADEFLNKLK